MTLSNVQTEPYAATLLDLAHQALLRSDYAALAELGAMLEREMVTPNRKIDESGLRVIRRKAERNAVCLMAAQRGIKAARRRLAEIRSNAKGLVTYNRAGKRAEMGGNSDLGQRI